MAEAPQIHVRLATDADLPFVYKSILKTFHFDSDARKIPQQAYFPGHGKKLEACLQRPTSKLAIACLPDDPATILGFLLAEGKLVHFVYCKAHFRRMGIARTLFEALGLSLPAITATHLTNQATRILHEKGIALAYDPYRF